LPRETQIHASPCACPECGGELRSLGEDVAEILEYEPARFKVIRHVRPKSSCANCQTIIQTPAPNRPIDRGMAGPGLLAHVLVSKYCDHLPLYRIWVRVHIRYYESAKNMGTGFRFACDFLHPRVQIAA
jgi:transposase